MKVYFYINRQEWIIRHPLLALINFRKILRPPQIVRKNKKCPKIIPRAKGVPPLGQARPDPSWPSRALAQREGPHEASDRVLAHMQTQALYFGHDWDTFWAPYGAEISPNSILQNLKVKVLRKIIFMTFFIYTDEIFIIYRMHYKPDIA